jgi:hydroxyacylglutathione hydrolase
MLTRHTFPVGAFQCNCTVLGDTVSKEALLIDPGDEGEKITGLIGSLGYRVKAIVHTHAHLDHIGASAYVCKHTGAPTYLHDDDVFLHKHVEMQASLLGLPVPDCMDMQGSLKEGQVFGFGTYELAVLHTPGHTPGSVCFYVPSHEWCFSGDTLFAGSVGRTDLWGGDFSVLSHSIKQKLYTLPSSTLVVPGHGPETHIDKERKTNPFVTSSNT